MRTRTRALALIGALLAVGCPKPPPKAPEPGPSPEPPETAPEPDGREAALEEATEGVSDPALAALLRAHWAFRLEADPMWATELGVHAYDGRLADRSAEAIAARRAKRRELLDRARALEGLNEADALSRDLFVAGLESAVASEICRFEDWSVNPRDNPVTRYNRLPELHPLRHRRDYESLIARYRAIGRAVAQERAHLEKGANDGLYATAESIRRVLEMVEGQLDTPIDQWPLHEPLEADVPGLEGEARADLDAALRAAVAEGVKPALDEYAATLRSLLPEAREQDESGLSSLPMGEACYEARIRRFTTLDLDAETIHEIGLEEVKETDAELARLGKKALGTEDLAATLEELRTDPELYFDTPEQVEAAARETLAAAKKEMDGYFGLLPQADCVVRRIPDYEAPFTTIAYYRPPHADGSKPGEYFINVLEPETRPRYQAKVLAVHEAIPGHHLQIAIAQELEAVPAFRKHGGFTAFVEGWALYTERLGAEMGLYDTDLDRIGVASFDAWRAGRLVVDTGIHAMGWSREKAKAYLEAHTALASSNVDNEVDRYIAWPGQALAYKLGQREIVSLRAEAEEALGDRFSLPAFHDVVLGAGALSLPALRKRVEAFIERRREETVAGR